MVIGSLRSGPPRWRRIPRSQQPAATPPVAQEPAVTAPRRRLQRAGAAHRPDRAIRNARFVAATMLPDGAVPPPDALGNFVIGPTHPPSPDTTAQPGVPQGTVHNFTMESTDSKIYSGIARAPGSRSMVDPNDPAKRVVNSAPPLHTPCGRVRPTPVRAGHDLRRSLSVRTDLTRCSSRHS